MSESMDATPDVDFDALWRELAAQFALGEWSLHGPNHWRNVERHGLQLAAVTGADVLVVALLVFAFFFLVFFVPVVAGAAGVAEAAGAAGVAGVVP